MIDQTVRGDHACRPHRQRPRWTLEAWNPFKSNMTSCTQPLSNRKHASEFLISWSLFCHNNLGRLFLNKDKHINHGNWNKEIILFALFIYLWVLDLICILVPIFLGPYKPFYSGYLLPPSGMRQYCSAMITLFLTKTIANWKWEDGLKAFTPNCRDYSGFIMPQ